MKIKSTMVLDRLENKLVLLDTERNIFIEVNEVGGTILEFIKNNNTNSVDDIVEFIKKEYDEAAYVIERDVVEFIDNLIEEGIVIK